MERFSMLLLAIFIPFIFALLCPASRKPLQIMFLGVTLTVFAMGLILWNFFYYGSPLLAVSNWLHLDYLSAYLLIVVLLVFWFCSLYVLVYFKNEMFPLRTLTLFSVFWILCLGTLVIVLVSNHMLLMWLGIEATTVFSAFLLTTQRSQASLEAMWKYVMLCVVGISFALIGTILVVVSLQKAQLGQENILLWTTLRAHAKLMDLFFLKMGFVFILVGYGTKAGFAPMHAWLPDTYSQAISPVSAMFSGAIAPVAIYAIMRFVPILTAATNNSGFSLGALEGIGLISLLVAVFFIFFQRDIKRLLAYSSIEHMGIIAIGFSLGKVGTFAALFHVFNHSMSKVLAFLSAGRIGQIYKTQNIAEISAALKSSRIWGFGLFVGMLSLIGAVPFSIFMSELQLIQGLIFKHKWGSLIIVTFALCVVFIGILRPMISMLWGKSEKSTCEKASVLEIIIAISLIMLVTICGIFMPDFFKEIVLRAASVIEGAQ